MSKTRGLALAGAMMLLGWAGAARAQEVDDATRFEFWPELDGYVTLNERSRLFFLASVTRNREDDVRQGMVGAHVDFFLRPFFRGSLRDKKNVFRRHYLAFRAGYRYSWDLGDSGTYREHRAVLEATARWPPLGGFVFMNRNRLDLRDVEGDGSWRYRNRTRVERDIALGERVVTPYAMVEFFYDSRYDAWSRERYFAGVEWPLGKTSIIDTYYCRQDDSQSSVAHVNAFGLAFNLFF